jgi:hypothetical protein
MLLCFGGKEYMNQDQPKSRRVASGAEPVAAGSRSVRYLTILVVLIALGGVWLVWKMFPRPNSAVEISSVPVRTDVRQDDPSATPTAAQDKSGDATSQPGEDATRQNPSNPGKSDAISKQDATTFETAAPRTEPTPLTRQLVMSLTQLDVRGGAVTPEQVSQWKQGLQQLVQQGTAAVPAIREFLEKNVDLKFDGLQGGNVDGYSSLRAGLFDALLQIGGPEAVDASRQVLLTTADPLEIALVARNLEQQSPGQYREEALNAARMTLEQAAKSNLNTRDVAPLFQLFQTYGDAGLLAGLQQSLPKWSYYETLALAGLPDGQGVPLLINQVQDPKTAGATASSLALQLLAQMSGQHPDAANALIEQARLNQIPASAWQQIGWVLAGDQLQFGSRIVDSTLPVPAGSGVRTYHIEFGNQNFYSTPSGATASAEQNNQRRGLIDQLLGVTSNPAAVAALQAARNALPGGQAKP